MAKEVSISYLFLACESKISNHKRCFFLHIVTHTMVCLIEKGLLFPGKMLGFDWDLPYGIYKLMEYTNDHSVVASCMHNSHILEYN